jgi:2'-5' RNA ligase
MKNRYNLALMPMTISEDVVRLSHAFSDIADKYVLGEKSLPHVTLCQFEAEEDEIDSIWKKVCEKWREEPIDLVFEKFSCLTFDNQVYWVSLLPNNTDALHDMHRRIAGIINQPIKKSFDPHMTLINTKNKEYDAKVDKYSRSYKPLRDMFLLKLGRCDDVGQFTEVIYTYGVRTELSCRKYTQH